MDKDPVSITEQLIDLTTALATEHRLEAVLERVVDAARRLTMAEGGRILMLDRANRHLHCVVAHFDGRPLVNTPAEAVSIYQRDGRFNLTEPSTFVVATGRILNIDSLDRSSGGFDFQAFRAEDERFGTRTQSIAIVPLTSLENITLGVLQLFNMHLDRNGGITGLTSEFERPITSFASHAAVAIANARLFEENQRLIQELDNINSQLEAENTQLRMQVGQTAPVEGFVGESPPFRATMDLIGRAAKSNVPVLVLGETGTGKEMIAKAIHASSARSSEALVAQNCAALPEHLLESELFGYCKGAFTGAVADKPGLVHEADGGTLFLDEIGDMPIGLQAKILRLLQEGEVRRVGSTKNEHVSVRIVAATHANLKEKIANSEFREDLFYRLSVFPVTSPALRERPSDIPLLIDYFLQRAAREHSRTLPALTPEAADALMRWRYPGNVRELKNLIERALLLIDEGGRIGLEHLPPEIGGASQRWNGAALGTPALPKSPDVQGDLKTIMQRYEALVIEAKLREEGWNQSRAARALDISRRNLVEKVRRYSIRPPARLEDQFAASASEN